MARGVIAMQKTVLLINKGKSFMVVTIAKSFTDAGYKVVEVEPTMEDIGEIQIYLYCIWAIMWTILQIPWYI